MRDFFETVLDDAFDGAETGIHWAEIGMGPQKLWVVMPYRNRVGTITMVEPNPVLFAAGKKYWGRDPHTRLFHGAIVPPHLRGKTIQLKEPVGGRKRAVSHVEGLPTIADGVKKKPVWRTVETVGLTMEDVDTGHFDVVMLDMEGAEWIALQQMVSRPKVLRVEMHERRALRNPYHEEIMDWAARENYEEVGRIRRDKVFVRT